MYHSNERYMKVKKISSANVEACSLPKLFDEEKIDFQSVQCVNWAEYPYKPKVSFRIAHTKDSILLHFKVREESVRAKYGEDNGSVWTDSCVEFFSIPAGDGIYYNIECNCIGTILIGAGPARNGREHAPKEITGLVQRWSSLGNEPFEERVEDTSWEVALIIPYKVFFKHQIESLDGKEVKITCPMDAIKAGIVLAPEDRKKDGLCTKLSIRHNLALPNLDLICSKLGVISSKKEDDLCEKAVKNLLIKTPTVEVNAGNLSGGNQQKVVVGKWLARNSRVVIFDEPTRGIDVGAKVEIYNLMNQLKKQGIAVMFVSSEMPEVLGIADRVIVMCDGKITGEVMAKETSQNEVLKFATEFEKKQQVS